MEVPKAEKEVPKAENEKWNNDAIKLLKKRMKVLGAFTVCLRTTTCDDVSNRTRVWFGLFPYSGKSD